MLRIVIPTFNRAQRVINLIEKLLEYKGDFELVIVDDKSSLVESNKLQKFSLSKKNEPKLNVVFNQENSGGAGARIIGAKYPGRYSFIWFLDDDDQVIVDDFGELLHFLKEQNPDFTVFASIYNNIESKPKVDCLNYRLRRYGQNFNTSCCVFSKDVYDRSGGWDKSLVAGQDTDLFLRISKLTDGIYYPGVKIFVIEHDNERITTNWKKQMKGKFQFIKKNYHDLHFLRLLRYILTFFLFVPYLRYLYNKVKI